MDSFARLGQARGYLIHVLRQHRQHHPDPAIERARHFAGLDIALRLQERHQPRLFPRIGIDHAVSAFRQHARDILQQAAAGNMCERIDQPGAHHRQQAGNIDAGGGHQRVDQQHIGIEQGRAVQLPALIRSQPPHERETVGMHAAGSEAQQHVAGRNLIARKLFAAFHRAHAEARQIVVARRIHAGHFRRFAADQRASGNFAAFRDTRDDIFGHAGVQFAGGEIIEEEQWFCALHDQIIGAHRNQVDSDRVVPPRIDRQLQLGAHAVIRRDQ